MDREHRSHQTISVNGQEIQQTTFGEQHRQGRTHLMEMRLLVGRQTLPVGYDVGDKDFVDIAVGSYVSMCVRLRKCCLCASDEVRN
jgi:hypothetical protein